MYVRQAINGVLSRFRKSAKEILQLIARRSSGLGETLPPSKAKQQSLQGCGFHTFPAVQYSRWRSQNELRKALDLCFEASCPDPTATRHCSLSSKRTRRIRSTKRSTEGRAARLTTQMAVRRCAHVLLHRWVLPPASDTALYPVITPPCGTATDGMPGCESWPRQGCYHLMTPSRRCFFEMHPSTTSIQDRFTVFACSVAGLWMKSASGALQPRHSSYSTS